MRRALSPLTPVYGYPALASRALTTFSVWISCCPAGTALVRATRDDRHSQSPAPHADGCLDAPVPICGNNPGHAHYFVHGHDATRWRITATHRHYRCKDAGNASPDDWEWRPSRVARTSAAPARCREDAMETL